MTERPTTDQRGRNALVWSFFVPPVGMVLGLRILWTTPNTAEHASVRTEARLAIVNCVVAVVVIVKGIALLRWLWERLAPLSG